MKTLLEISAAIRDIPDFPKKGIVFKDITPLLQNAELFQSAIEQLAKALAEKTFDLVCGIESRGFIFGAALAFKLGKGFIPIRKPGKLPYQTYQVEYALEYGSDSVEIHRDAIRPGQKVVLIDDLLATGGTAAAGAELIKKCGGQVTAIGFVIELGFLNGSEKLKNYSVYSLIRY